MNSKMKLLQTMMLMTATAAIEHAPKYRGTTQQSPVITQPTQLNKKQSKTRSKSKNAKQARKRNRK